MKLIGIKSVDFTDKEGKQIKGTSLYVTYEDEYTDGLVAEKIWVNSNATMDSNIRVGCNVDFVYNKYGKVMTAMAAK